MHVNTKLSPRRFTLGWGRWEVGKKKDLLEPRTAAKGLGVCNFFSPGGPEKRRRSVRGPPYFFFFFAKICSQEPGR